MMSNNVDHYKLLHKIGEGGMGEVYLAEDTSLGRKVALKFLSSKFLFDSRARIRFFREARTAAALNHPNIVTIHEINESGDRIYIVMEYVKGETLGNKINMLSVTEVVDIAVQICEGLEVAHKAGIVHRDIKPQNIILDQDNTVKILDFGLAKFKEDTRITDEIARLGTALYMSPEQIEGKMLDQRTDIWSLGVLLYEMVTRQIPFKGEYQSEIFNSILKDFPIPPSEICDNVPVQLEKIILKSMRKNVKLRYSSAAEILRDLETFKKTLEGDKKSPSAPTIEIGPQRRYAAVLSAEISVYRENREDREKTGTEEEAAAINESLGILAAVVETYDGWINKIMGSSLTVFFGIPKALEGTAQRAVNAAIEMRGSLHRLNQKKHPASPLEIRTGIEYGPVIAAPIRDREKRDYTVTGESLSLASQYKDSAAAGQVVVGPSAHKYTHREFEYKPLKPLALKDRESPAAVFELTSPRPNPYRRKIIPRKTLFPKPGTIDMIGRSKELEHLKFHVLKVINGEGAIVSVAGEPGIGKSKLISALKELEDLRKVTLLEGQASLYGQQMKYHLVIDMIKNRAGINQRDSEVDAFLKLEKAVTGIYPGESDEIFPCIASLAGIKLRGKYAETAEPDKGKNREALILKFFQELIIKQAQIGPVVCILHDLHWADRSSIQLVESLFSLAENLPVLFIPVLRPYYAGTSEGVMEILLEKYASRHSGIFLEPLDEKQCHILIRGFPACREWPEDIIEAVTRRSQGIPYFIEELLSSLIDEGIFTIQSGKCGAMKPIHTIGTPQPLRDIFTAQVDRQEEATILLLKLASVMGRNFYYKILIQVAKEIPGIHQRLENLKKIQVIEEQGQGEEQRYSFKHVPVQEVIYESIPLKTRRDLHLKTAAAVESVFPEQLHRFYTLLAHHYSKGENREKAEEYLIKAGQEALKSTAPDEFSDTLQETLKFFIHKYSGAMDPGKIASLNKNMGMILYNQGHWDEAVDYFDRALAQWGEPQPKNKYSTYLKQAINRLWLIRMLYLPCKRAKRIPSPKDSEILDILYKRVLALHRFDLSRCFAGTVTLLRRLVRFEITGIENGHSIPESVGTLFPGKGILFKVSRKILSNTKIGGHYE